jgi:predicted porin
VQTKSVQGTKDGYAINSPYAGMTANSDPITVDQMVGLTGKLPVRFMGGGYLRLSAYGLSNNTGTEYTESAVAKYSYIGDFSHVLVLGADSKIKLNDRIGVDLDWAKTIASKGSFQTVSGGAEKNNAFEGSVGYDAGKLKLGAGYKYIDPLFYAPGAWDRIGPWLNPTNVKGPTFNASYDFGENFGLKVGGEFLSGARHFSNAWMYPEDDLNKIDAGIRYNLSKSFQATLDWEGLYAKTDDGEGGRVHPTLQYVTIGTGYHVTDNTLLKFAYEIGDFNGKSVGLPGIGEFNHFNYNTFTTQVAVKF